MLTHINGRIIYDSTISTSPSDLINRTIESTRSLTQRRARLYHPFRNQSNCTRSAWIDSCVLRGKFRMEHWSIEMSAELIVGSLIARKAFNHGEDDG